MMHHSCNDNIVPVTIMLETTDRLGETFLELWTHQLQKTPLVYFRHWCSFCHQECVFQDVFGSGEIASALMLGVSTVLDTTGAWLQLFNYIITCEYGAKNQMAECISAYYALYTRSQGAVGLVSLDEDSTSWLQEICSDIGWGAQMTN